jgi:hypothetical protein
MNASRLTAAILTAGALAPAVAHADRLTTTQARAEVHRAYDALTGTHRYRIVDAHRVSRTAIAVRIREHGTLFCEHPCTVISPAELRRADWTLRVIVRQRTSGRLVIPSPYL